MIRAAASGYGTPRNARIASGGKWGTESGKIKAAVARETREKGVREAERRRRAARRNIIHDKGILGRSGRRLAQNAPEGNGARTWSHEWGQNKTLPIRDLRCGNGRRSRFALENASELSVT